VFTALGGNDRKLLLAVLGLLCTGNNVSITSVISSPTNAGLGHQLLCLEILLIAAAYQLACCGGTIIVPSGLY